MLGEDFERMKLIELAQFVLNRETEDIRSELHEYLVCHAIYHAAKNGGLTKSEIQSTLKEIYGMIMPMNLIEDSLQRLDSKNALIVQDRPQRTYLLSEERQKEVSSHHKDYEALKDTVIKELLTRIRKTCPDVSEQESEIAEVLFCTISRIFTRYGSACSEQIIGAKGGVQDIALLPDFQQISIDCVKKLIDSALRKKVKDELRAYFVEPSKEFIYFLHSMAQAYTIAQILVLDPTLQTLAKESFSRKKLFLDTNIILSLMCVAEAHKNITKIVSLTKKLGVKMVYTPETRREFLDYIDYSKKLYERIPIHKKSIIKKTEPLMENAFIRSYWIESKEKRLRWSAFIARMEGFQEFLEDKFSISIETPPKEIWKDPEYDKLDRAVFLANPDKPQPTVAHDAYHLLMIKRIREKETTDELGMMSYFLSRDYTLSRAERMVDRGGRIPSSLSIDVWSQMILPFLSPRVVADEASEAYMKIMSSKFPLLTKSIHPKDLIDMMGLWMDDPSINTDVLRKIVGNRFVRERLKQLRAKPKIESSKVARLIDPIIAMAVSSARKSYEERTSKLKQKYDREISELKKDVKELQSSVERTKKIHKPLLIIGIVMFAIMTVSALLSGHLGLVLPDAYFYALTFAGIAFIASSVFGVRALEKVRRP